MLWQKEANINNVWLLFNIAAIFEIIIALLGGRRDGLLEIQ